MGVVIGIIVVIVIVIIIISGGKAEKERKENNRNYMIEARMNDPKWPKCEKCGGPYERPYGSSQYYCMKCWNKMYDRAP